jgi:hypothetical protein
MSISNRYPHASHSVGAKACIALLAAGSSAAAVADSLPNATATTDDGVTGGWMTVEMLGDKGGPDYSNL